MSLTYSCDESSKLARRFRHRDCRLRRCRRGEGRIGDLLRPGAHLPALPLQPAHPLLAPLGSHLWGLGLAARETEMRAYLISYSSP